MPRTGHRARQRRGDIRRTQRSRQLPCLQASAEAVEDADHRVRRPSDRRPRRPGLARADQADTAQLDRPQRRRADPLPRAVDRRADQRVHDAPRHHVRRDLHGRSLPSTRSSTSSRRRRGQRARRRSGQAAPRTPFDAIADYLRTAGSLTRRRASGRVAPEDRRLHRRVRDEPRDWRVDPGVRRRLRADGLRHRGDHGGARSGRARLGVRRGVRPADRAHRAAARRLGGQGLRRRRARDQQWLPRRARRRRREAQDHRLARAERLGEGTVTYRLRDWLFSRQRYWGEPFPIIYDDTGLPIAVPESMLPVLLPEVDDFSPRTFADDDETSMPEPPLARAHDWVEVDARSR